MKNIFYCVLIAALMCCTDEKSTIVNADDYTQYLQEFSLAAFNNTEEEMKFWNNRLFLRPNDQASLTKLAFLHAQLFQETGVVNHIQTSDSLYLAILNDDENNVAALQALASNAITQHEFRLAEKYIRKAVLTGDKRAASLLILADVCMEVGDDLYASKILKEFKNKNAFAYLIRETKVQDQKGNLDSAILLMEKAVARVKGNSVLQEWIWSNLGDMYGHANRLGDAYAAYLTALKINPQSDYPLKGIAWIALSHDHNTTEAKRIINHLASRKDIPEAYLLLAEAEKMENNTEKARAQTKRFVELVTKPGYKKMYYKYLAIIQAEELMNPQACLAIADEEIENRPTAESYDLKAWAYYHLKEYAEALKVAQEYVEGQTFEPEAMYHLGMIYLANNNNVKARQLLEEALASEFELGPSTTSKIKKALATL